MCGNHSSPGRPGQVRDAKSLLQVQNLGNQGIVARNAVYWDVMVSSFVDSCLMEGWPRPVEDIMVGRFCTMFRFFPSPPLEHGVENLAG